MCTLPEPDTTLSRLRDFQRAVSKKRELASRAMSRSVETADPATELAECLFPECRMSQANEGLVGENVKQIGEPLRDTEDENRVFEMLKIEDDAISSDDIAKFFGVRGSAELGAADVFATGRGEPQKETGNDGGDVEKITPGKLGAGEGILTNNTALGGVERTGVDALETRPASRKLNNSAKGFTLAGDASLRNTGIQQRAFSSVAKERYETTSSEPFEKEELDLRKREGAFSMVRGDGSLPWKRRSGRVLDPCAYYAEGEFRVLDIEQFTNSAGLTRGNWKLPRKTLLFSRGSVSRRENYENKSGTTGRHQRETTDFSAILKGLNDLQQEAVLSDPEKACLVLAGPGSGKTRVLTHRFAYLVKKYDISPFNILAVTFTNKAATEMKIRISALLGQKFAPDWAESGPRLSVGTFHAACARILRAYGSKIGVNSNFDICDTSDSRQLVSRLLRTSQNGTSDASAVRMNQDMISKLKNDSEGNESSLKKVWPPFVYKRISELRRTYDQELRSMNKLDFDDILLEARKLLITCPEALDELQDRYAYILVDEWQDTNHVQFDLVSLLSEKRKNLFVVGDADQSIYKFRGADSGNVRRFVETFPEAVTIALECNYRSSAAIIGAAQAVIEGDSKRPDKKMMTLNKFGNKVLLRETYDDRKEAQFVISTITSMLEKGNIGSFSDVAILYRTNAQSRMIEEVCVQSNIPYRLLSGTKFYDRQEIRDLVAYLKLLANPADNDSFRRAVNVPPRGIGKKTIDELEKFSSVRNVPLLTGLGLLVSAVESGDTADCNVDLKRNAVSKLAGFHELYEKLLLVGAPCGTNCESLANGGKQSPKAGVDLLLTSIIKETEYTEYLEKRSDAFSEDDEASEKARERVGNINELVRAAARHADLHRYLESVNLMEQKSWEDTNGKETKEGGKEAISLITLHGGKGLEFGTVFIIGAEDNMIPIARAKEEETVEEERRLLYVGMTRAKQHLIITWRAHKSISQRGKIVAKVQSAGPSRFLDEIPKEFARRVETAAAKLEREERSRAKKTPTVTKQAVKRGRKASSAGG